MYVHQEDIFLPRQSTVTDRYIRIAFLNCTEQNRITDGSTKLPEVWATSTGSLMAQYTADTRSGHSSVFIIDIRQTT